MAKEIKKDIVVIGAGVAGICAAVSAARLGAKVALVHNRPVPGGNGSSEIGVPINGGASIDYSASVYGRESGIVSELQTEILNKGKCYQSKGLLDMAFFDFIYNEENVELFLNTNVYEVETENDEVKSVTGFQLNAENTYKFIAPVFIDCSGDGFVGCAAGAEFMYGREGKAEFNESLAPDEPDSFTQGGTIFWGSEDMGHEVKYTRPAFAHDINKMEFKKNFGRFDLHRVLYSGGLGTLWWMEYGGQLDTVHQNEDVTLELRKIVYGFWDYVKNSGDERFPDAKNYMLTHVSPVVGKRESRRFKGDYILTQNDIFDKTVFPDAISTGGWVIDCHAPLGIYDEGKASNWVTHRGLYSIPYRCVYSRNIKNLFFGGRIISTTHIAHGSTRVIGTGAAAAHASGIAAYLCSTKGITPREVDINELQDLLVRNDQYIMGRQERYNKELLDCKITASSTSDYENTAFTGFKKLNKKYYIALPSAINRIDSVDIYVSNISDDDTVLEYNVCTGKLIESFLPTILLHNKSITIPKGYSGYITFPLDAKGLPDKKVYIEMLKNENIEIGISKYDLTGSPCFDENSDPTSGIFIDGVGMKINHFQNACFKNVLPEQNMFEVKNVLNGFTRPYGVSNSWISKTNGDEWIEISYDEPKFVDEIQLVFNDDLKRDRPAFPQTTLVKDYILYVDDENIRINDNQYRMNRYKIGKNVSKIKIKPLKNGGHPRFEIFGIRLY